MTDAEPPDGGLLIDPAVARVLLTYHEAVASATEQAYRDLARLGAWSPDAEDGRHRRRFIWNG